MHFLSGLKELMPFIVGAGHKHNVVLAMDEILQGERQNIYKLKSFEQFFIMVLSIMFLNLHVVQGTLSCIRKRPCLNVI